MGYLNAAKAVVVLTQMLDAGEAKTEFLRVGTIKDAQQWYEFLWQQVVATHPDLTVRPFVGGSGSFDTCQRGVDFQRNGETEFLLHEYRERHFLYAKYVEMVETQAPSKRDELGRALAEWSHAEAQSLEPMLDVMLNPDDTPHVPGQVDRYLSRDARQPQPANRGKEVFVIPEAVFGIAGAARLTHDGTLVFAVEGTRGEFDGDELIELDGFDSRETLLVGLSWIAELQTNPHYIIGNPAMYDALKEAVLIEDAPELGLGKTRLTTRGDNAVEAWRVYQQRNPPKPKPNDWVQWQQRFYDEYKRVSLDYQRRTGEPNPLSFPEWMDEQTDFTLKHSSAQISYDFWQQRNSDMAELIGYMSAALESTRQVVKSVSVRRGVDAALLRYQAWVGTLTGKGTPHE